MEGRTHSVTSHEVQRNASVREAPSHPQTGFSNIRSIDMATVQTVINSLVCPVGMGQCINLFS